MTENEFIESLPEALRELAGLWLPVLRKWGFEAAAAAMWKTQHRWYDQLLRNMTTEQHDAEDKRRKEYLEDKRKSNAEYINAQKEAIWKILFAALSELL